VTHFDAKAGTLVVVSYVQVVFDAHRVLESLLDARNASVRSVNTVPVLPIAADTNTDKRPIGNSASDLVPRDLGSFVRVVSRV